MRIITEAMGTLEKIHLLSETLAALGIIVAQLSAPLKSVHTIVL